MCVVSRPYVLTCARVFIFISFHYVRSIKFASYDVFGFPCTSKCVVNVNGLTRLQLQRSFDLYCCTAQLGNLVAFLSTSTCCLAFGCCNAKAAYLKGLFDGVSFQTRVYRERWSVAIDWCYSMKLNSRRFG